MTTTQQIVDRDMVRDVAAGIDEAIEVSLTDGGEIELRKGRTVETYATREEAIAALRASW